MGNDLGTIRNPSKVRNQPYLLEFVCDKLSVVTASKLTEKTDVKGPKVFFLNIYINGVVSDLIGF